VDIVKKIRLIYVLEEIIPGRILVIAYCDATLKKMKHKCNDKNPFKNYIKKYYL